MMSNLIKGKIELEGGSVMAFELYPDIAPKSVENFVKLAESGFYDGQPAGQYSGRQRVHCGPVRRGARL